MAKEAEAKFISVLKDAEEVGVNLQNEICFLDDANKEMSEEINRLQREFLAWEKKWKMAVEARERVEKERAATGEIGAMKLEIHRMSVSLIFFLMQNMIFDLLLDSQKYLLDIF